MCGFLACMALSGDMLPERKTIETAVNTLFHRGQTIVASGCLHRVR